MQETSACLCGRRAGVPGASEVERGTIHLRSRNLTGAGLRREKKTGAATLSLLLSLGDLGGARERINAIDARYGGLAAPAIVELDAKLAAHE
jgi:hypothetical protein